MFICSPRYRLKYLCTEAEIRYSKFESRILVKTVGWSKHKLLIVFVKWRPVCACCQRSRQEMNWLFEKRDHACISESVLGVDVRQLKGAMRHQTPTDTALKNSGSCAVAPSTSPWPADFMEALARVTLTPAGPGVSLASTEMTCPMKCWKTAHTHTLLF